MEYKGIDVSKYQGNIDYSKVKASGITFVIIRIGYGMYDNQKDSKFEENYNNAVKNNIPVGVYLYSYAKNKEEALKEANTVLTWLKNRKLNLPVYLDVEDKSQQNLSKQTLTEICTTFCNKIQQSGYWAGIYANKYWFTSILDASSLEKKYTIWVAQYNKENTYKGKYDMWQYTSGGTVSGINGKVDMNILYKDIFINSKKTDESLPNLSNYIGTSIVDALKQNNVDYSFDNRKKLYKLTGFNDDYVGSAIQNLNLLNKLQGNIVINKYYNVPNYIGFSLVDALKKINVNSSFDNRKKIASKNGISNYKGTNFENLKLLKLLKRGKLLKV